MHCSRIDLLSRNLDAKVTRFRCIACRCKVGREVRRVFDVRIGFKGTLTRNHCDDVTRKVLPDPATMVGSTRWILRAGKCPDGGTAILWGCHSGRFRIFDGNTNLIFRGSLHGTRGVDPEAKPARRCCHIHALGMLRGKGLENLQGHEICASYLMRFTLDHEDACLKKPPVVRAQFDGTVISPC